MRRTWLFGLILAVPLIGFGTSQGLQAYQDAKLRSAAREQIKDADPEKITELTLDTLCSDLKGDPGDLATLCTSRRDLHLLSAASIIAGVTGLLLVAAIFLAGQISRRRRWLLALLFRPGLYASMVVLLGLITTHAAILIVAIYYGESTIAGRVHTVVLGMVAGGALLGVGALAKASFGVVRKAKTLVVGRSLSRDQAPRLWQHVDSTAERLGALKPHNIVVGLDPNFFVTEADVVTLDGLLAGRTLYCSLPSSRLLTTSEFTAIVGHELGHFRGSDTRFSQRFYPVYRGTSIAIASLLDSTTDDFAVLPLLPAVAVLNYFLKCFSEAELEIGRDRELTADACGSEVASPSEMAVALLKVHAFSPIWEGFDDAAEQALERGQAYVNASALFASAAQRNAVPGILEGIGGTHLSHPTDSHPSLAIRLGALGIRELEPLQDLALAVKPDKPCTELIANLETVEEDLTTAYQELLIRRRGIDTPEEAPAAMD